MEYLYVIICAFVGAFWGTALSLFVKEPLECRHTRKSDTKRTKRVNLVRGDPPKGMTPEEFELSTREKEDAWAWLYGPPEGGGEEDEEE